MGETGGHLEQAGTGCSYIRNQKYNSGLDAMGDPRVEGSRKPFLFKVELGGTHFKILFALNTSAWSIDVFIDKCTITL